MQSGQVWHYNGVYSITANPRKIQAMTDDNQAPSKAYKVLTFDEVEEIQTKRGEYIVYYMGYLLSHLIAYFTTDPEVPLTPLVAVLLLAALYTFVSFLIRFARVFTLMDYPKWMWIPACIAGTLPIPGVLVVAMADRSVARTLNKALDE